ncbi:MAG TPA: hypothetical protein VE974_10755 [Thermoanaerobaculia bacterium]|nr:hypothetical protein [Thermoanaerobaculia bacterium]
MARLDVILNLVVDLTKRIHLRAGVVPDSTELAQFVAPRDPVKPWDIVGGARLDWFASNDYYRRLDGFADLLIETEADLAGGDAKSFREVFLNTLENHALDPALFNPHIIRTASVPTLFDARADKNVATWRRRLWDTIRPELAASIRVWLVLYPLHQIRGEGFHLGHDGISILDPDDAAVWQRLAARYPGLRAWNPRTGLHGHPDDMHYYGGAPPRWLACEVTGTAAGATKNAANRMWTFIALLLAHYHSISKSVLIRLHARTPYMCGQFSTASMPDDAIYTQREIGALLPHQVSELNVNDALISSLRSWYAARDAADEEGRRRATIASHFVHYGINADRDVERYLHFFVALDALFGQRGRVELGIRDGFSKLHPGDTAWVVRAAELYQLRNELAHGGTSTIETWDRLDAYDRRFQTEPLSDLSTASTDALLRYFAVRDLPVRRNARVRVTELLYDIGRAFRRFGR